MLNIDRTSARPLETVHVEFDQAHCIRVADGCGRVYARGDGPELAFTVSGALGCHVVTAHDEDGRELDRATFEVDCQTSIEDPGGRYAKLTKILKKTFVQTRARKSHILFADGELYRMFSVASRDNVHAMKGAMYFMRHMKDGIDLHAKYQREDGLIWDFATPRDPDLPHQHEWRWEEQFSRATEDKRVNFGRQPAENDVEHQHIRGIWRAWKCTGDDEWMAGKLDSALAAMRFSRSNEWFWSEKYGLLKRPFTIDTWDFVSLYDRYTLPTSGDSGLAKPGVTVYGIMHGDNTGMADSCEKLAECLEHVGRQQEAQEAREFAAGLRERLDELAWNGEFFTHHVSEDPSFERDFGVDESEQVSLSNAYSLTRGIRHEQAVAIIETYQRIRREMPESSPGEFYMVYPPFRKGWGPHASPWQYTNGAVTGIVAGELAAGAFQHGFENYGVDILERWLGLMEEFGDSMPWGLRGKMPELPEREFETVDLREVANADLACKDDGVPGWLDDPGMDMRELPRGLQELRDVPFDIIEGNERRSLLRLAHQREGFAEDARLEVDRPVGSVYFLHAANGGPVAGEVVWHYDDGSTRTKYVMQNRDVNSAWNPPGESRDRSKVRKDYFNTVTAWRGACPRFWSVGLTAHGMDNPEPEKQVSEIELRAADGAAWLVVAMTLSDEPGYFMPGREGHGVPEAWAAGALTNALLEGLAGLRDTDRNMGTVQVSPRWAASGVDRVTACIKYEDGTGYVRYTYEKTQDALKLHLAGNSVERRFELLLPEGFPPGVLTVDGRETDYETRQLEGSRYVCFDADGPAARRLELGAR